MANASFTITAENKMSPELIEAKKQLQDLTSTAQKMNSTLKTIGTSTAFTAVTAGVNLLTKAVNSATNAVSKLASSTVQFTKNFTKTATTWAKGYEEMRLTYERLRLSLSDPSSFNYIVSCIDTLAQSTTIAKDEIEAMVSELAMLGKSASEIDKVSKAAVYLSTVTGRDLNSSMTTLLNTFNGVTTQLDKLGLNMKRFTNEELASGAAVDEIIKKYKYLNDSIAENSLMQSVTDIKEGFNTIKDEIGKVVADFIGPKLKKIAKAINEITRTFTLDDGSFDLKGLIRTGKEFASAVYEEFITRLTDTSTMTKLKNFLTALIQNLVPVLTTIISVAWNTVQAAFKTSKLESYYKDLEQAKADLAKYEKKINTAKNNGREPYSQDIEGYQQASSSYETAKAKIAKAGLYIENKVQESVDLFTDYMDKKLPTAIENTMKATEELAGAFKGVVSTAYDSTFGKAFDRSGSYWSKNETHNKEIAESLRDIRIEANAIRASIYHGDLAKAWSESQPSFNTNWTSKNGYQYIGKSTQMISNQLDYANELYEDQTAVMSAVSEKALVAFGEIKATEENLLKITSSNLPKIVSEINSIPTEVATSSFKEIEGSNKTLYQQLKDKLFGYSYSQVTKQEDGSYKAETIDVAGLLNVLGERGVSEFTQTLDSVIGSLGIFGDMILGMNPLIAALKPVIEGFVSVMAPMIETVLLPLQSTLTYIGQLLAGLFAPILDRLAPVFEFIAKILAMVIQPVLALMQVPLQMIAALLTFLEPILNLVGKAFEYLLIPINAFAATMQWLGAWIKFIILGIYNFFSWIWGGTIDNPTPGSWSSYYDALSSNTQYTSVGSSTVATDIAEGLITGTSTSTGVTNASYTGAGSITMNIYVEAPIVGSGGMEEFAIMLRKEFEAIGYYNVA